MPEIVINYLAVLVGAVASMVIGFVWYGPLFGKTWMQLMKIDTKKMDGKQNMGMTYGVAFIGALIMAFVLAHTFYFAHAFFNGDRLMDSLQNSFWSWLGFIVPVGLGSVLFDSKPVKLFAINVGYHLVSLLVMGIAIAMM